MPGAKSHFEKNVFLELLLRITEEEKWNLFEKLGQLRTPSAMEDKSAVGNAIH